MLDIRYFNPLSPCGERRQNVGYALSIVYISIHSPHAGRDLAAINYTSLWVDISIHSPHAGRDFTSLPWVSRLKLHFNPLSPCGERPGLNEIIDAAKRFQSTLPMRGETEIFG